MKRLVFKVIESRSSHPRLSLWLKNRSHSNMRSGERLGCCYEYPNHIYERIGGYRTSPRGINLRRWNLNNFQVRSYKGFSQLKSSRKRNYFRAQVGGGGGYDKKGKSEYDIILIIIVINGLVYLIFSMMSEEEKRKYRSRYTASLKNIREGKLYCLLTSNFVHADFLHFAFNAFVFYSFGRPLSIVVGRQRFIRLLALSSILSPLSYLAEKYFYFRKEPTQPGKMYHYVSSGCGLSGVTMAVVTAACVLMPHQSVLLYFVIPMNLRMAWFGIIGYDIYSLFRKKWRNRIASSAHLGGAASALILYRKFLSNLILPF